MADFNNILSLLIWFPIITGCIWLCFYNHYTEKAANLIAISNAFWNFILLKNFDLHIYGWQFVEHYTMLPELGVSYSLGIDGLALSLITLSNFVNLIVILSNFKNHDNYGKHKAYLLILNGITNGLLSSTNAMLFYMFFEGMLFPLFLIIGSSKKTTSIFASIKFFLYNFLSSMLFLLAIIYLRKTAISSGIPTFQSLDLTNFYLLKLDLVEQIYLFIAFFISCSIKIPIFPLHSWLPQSHVEAPTSGSMFISSLGLKIGSFIMFRFLLPITHDACYLFHNSIIWVLLISILYIGFITIVQKNLKRLIAYYSIIHMAFITLGIMIGLHLIKTKELSAATIGLIGSMFQILSHSLIAVGMLFSVDILQDRLYTSEIKCIKELIYRMPVFTRLFMLLCLAYIALPGTSGFVGEFFIMISSLKINLLFGLLLAIGLILPASYILWNYNKMSFDKFVNAHIIITDVTLKERIFLFIIILLILFLGIYPSPTLKILNNYAVNLIQIMENK